MFHQRYDPLFPRLKHKHGNSKKLQVQVHIKTPFGIKIHRQFWNLQTPAVCLASKVNTNNEIIFQPSFYFFILQKCWNNKIVRRPLFKGDDKIPAKLVRLMIFSEWWQFTPKIMRQVRPKLPKRCCQKAFLAACFFFIFLLHRFSSAPSRLQLDEKMEVPLARTSWSTPGIGCKFLIWFDFINLNMN